MRDSTLIARPFSSQELLLFAAPSYLKRAGRPAKLSDLHRHTGVLFRVPSSGKDRPWQFRVAGRTVTFAPGSRVHADDGDAIGRAAVLGLGLAQVPHYMVSQEISRGDLVELMASLRPTPMPIAAVMPSGRMVPSRVRTLLELIERSAKAYPAPPEAGSRKEQAARAAPRAAVP